MNIAIGKLGRAMFFDKANWSIYAGDDSPLIFYFTLAKKYPQHTFYILGRSDFTKFKQKNSQVGFGKFNKNKVDIPSNIIDLLEDARKFAGPEECRLSNDTHLKGHEPWRILENYIKHIDLKLDLGLIMQGPDTSTSIGGEGVLCASKPTEAIPLAMGANYCGPIIHVINSQGFPWYSINEDPRYVPPKHHDIINDEQFIFSQIEGKYKTKRIVDYTSGKWREYWATFKYAGLERMFLADKKKIDFSNPDHIEVDNNVYAKNNKFILTLNDGTDRLEYLEKWVLDIHPNIKVYGKWSNAAKKKHPNTFIEKGIVQMEPEMWQSMFTYIPAFTKRRKNFVTQKPWKMVYYGIIPFYDKNSYDTDNYFKEFPDYVKVETPQEMWEKIDYLYEHRDEYQKLLKQFYDMLEDKYFTGQFICDTFGPVIEKREQELC